MDWICLTVFTASSAFTEDAKVLLGYSMTHTAHGAHTARPNLMMSCCKQRWKQMLLLQLDISIPFDCSLMLCKYGYCSWTRIKFPPQIAGSGGCLWATLSSSRGLTRTTTLSTSGRAASEITQLARSLIRQSGDQQAYPTTYDHHHATDIHSYMMPFMVMLF